MNLIQRSEEQSRANAVIDKEAAVIPIRQEIRILSHF